MLNTVTSRATGGSAPLQVLEVYDSEKWLKSFRKSVISDARHMHLAGNRWSRFDYIGLGGALAVILLVFALAFASADLFVDDTGSDDDWTRESWFYAAAVAWAGMMFALGALRSLRETAAGRRATAHWLGYRDYCRQTRAFEDLPPAAVTIWERYIAYAVAVGSAHDTAEALPFATDDPGTAWTRYSGVWRQIRIEYPTRLGFGQVPWKAALEGFARMAFFGGLAIVILPILLPVVLDLREEFTADLTSSEERNVWFLVVGIIAVQLGMGAYWGVMGLAGLIRFLKGVGDLTSEVVVEGQVVRVHGRRVAVDDGKSDETTAWFQPAACPPLSRGMKVRVTRTPYLHHVKRVEVLG